MKTKLNFTPIIFAAFFIVIGGQASFGQYADSMGMQWNNGGSALASTMIWSNIFYRTPGANKAKSGSSNASRPAASVPTQTKPSTPPARSNPNVVKFHPSGTYIKTGELAASLASTQAERQQYQKLMNAVLDAFGQKAASAGFSNDLPAALAFFLGENLRIYRGSPDLSDRQYIELRNVISEAVISSGALNNLTDRQKQEMYETLVAYTGITQYGYEEALKAGNQPIAQGYQKVAGQNLLSVTKTAPDQINFDPKNLGSSSTVISPTEQFAGSQLYSRQSAI